MLAVRQIIEDPQDVIAIPPEFRHRRTEVIFMALDSLPEQPAPTVKKHTLMSLAGCWEDETLERAPQGDYETRRELE
ncbi:MAG: hypothetical protein Q7T96_01740 [Methylobacter sp.]|nr:hypothetical protein [Methylobacter sp.]